MAGPVLADSDGFNVANGTGDDPTQPLGKIELLGRYTEPPGPGIEEGATKRVETNTPFVRIEAPFRLAPQWELNFRAEIPAVWTNAVTPRNPTGATVSGFGNVLTAETFKRGRDFAACVGLTPLQHSTGGKQKFGATSKMGERTIRRLLIIGASAVVRQAARQGAPEGSWLARMLPRKPRMLVTVALANKMARVVWALLANGEVYKASVAAAV